jgi:hypothetical protein
MLMFPVKVNRGQHYLNFFSLFVVWQELWHQLWKSVGPGVQGQVDEAVIKHSSPNKLLALVPRQCLNLGGPIPAFLPYTSISPFFHVEH